MGHAAMIFSQIYWWHVLFVSFHINKDSFHSLFYYNLLFEIYYIGINFICLTPNYHGHMDRF